jgi:hypothetical protein
LTLLVPENKAARRIALKHLIDERLSRLRFTNPYLLCPYEVFLTEQGGFMERIVRFLDCDPSKSPRGVPRSVVQSIGVKPMLNEAELQEHLQKRGLAWDARWSEEVVDGSLLAESKAIPG